MAENKATDSAETVSSSQVNNESSTETDIIVDKTSTSLSSSSSAANEEASTVDAQNAEQELFEKAKKQFADMMSSLSNNNRLLRQFISYMQTEIKVLKKTLGSKRKDSSNHRPKESKRKIPEGDDGDSSEYQNGTDETPTRTTKRARKPTSYATRMLSNDNDDEEADDETFGKPTKRTKSKKKSKKK